MITSNHICSFKNNYQPLYYSYGTVTKPKIEKTNFNEKFYWCVAKIDSQVHAKW